MTKPNKPELSDKERKETWLINLAKVYRNQSCAKLSKMYPDADHSNSDKRLIAILYAIMAFVGGIGLGMMITRIAFGL